MSGPARAAGQETGDRETAAARETGTAARPRSDHVDPAAFGPAAGSPLPDPHQAVKGFKELAQRLLLLALQWLRDAENLTDVERSRPRQPRFSVATPPRVALSLSRSRRADGPDLQRTAQGIQGGARG